MNHSTLSLLLLVACLPAVAERRAENVILLLADAGGTSTLHAASIHGPGAPRKMYVQYMPHIGLSDTSTASNWVSASAAGNRRATAKILDQFLSPRFGDGVDIIRPTTSSM